MLLLQIKAPAGELGKMIELGDEGNALSGPATAAEVEACSEEHRSTVYKAEVSLLSSAHTVSAKKRNLSSSMMMTGHWGRKRMRGAENEAGVRAGQGPLAQSESVADATPADSNALRLEAECDYQVLKFTMKEYCFVWEAAFNELEDLHKAKTGSASSEKVITILADAPYKTRSAQDQASPLTIYSQRTTSRMLWASRAV